NQLNLAPFLLTTIQDPRSYLYFQSSLSLSGIFGASETTEGQFSMKNIRAFIPLSPEAEQVRAGQVCCTLIQSYRDWLVRVSQGQLDDNSSLQFTGLLGDGELRLQKGSTLEAATLLFKGQSDLSKYETIHQKILALRGQLLWQGELSFVPNKPLSYELSLKTDQSSPGMISIDGWSPPIRNIHMDITIDEEFITIGELSARKGGGWIRGSHRMSVSGDQGDGHEGIRLLGRRNAIQFNHKIFGPMMSVVDFDLRLQKNNHPWMLSGEVNLVDVLSQRPLNLVRDMFFDPADVTITNQWDSQAKDFLVLDLQLKSDNSIRLRNFPLNLTLGGDLNLTGSPAELSLDGFLEMTEGTFYYKKEYEITEGMLYFNKGYSLDPNIEVRAQTNISDYEITIDMTGSSKDPKFFLAINPPTRSTGQSISQLEILYLMANDQLPEGGSGWENQQDIVISQALSMAFNTIYDRVSEQGLQGDQRFIRDISIYAYAQGSGARKIRASAPINTGQENLNVVVYGDTEEAGLKAEYELDQNVVTSFKYAEVNNKSSEKSKEDSAPSVGLKFSFRFP
ncbi:MAG: translocation/assembly module TamB domain-containing protein, partial [Proteobacteria bacterium]|nr:translocation/assembly module TamB domain-containing protein [Pseudomonadota bacterium]